MRNSGRTGRKTAQPSHNVARKDSIYFRSLGFDMVTEYIQLYIIYNDIYIYIMIDYRFPYCISYFPLAPSNSIFISSTVCLFLFLSPIFSQYSFYFLHLLKAFPSQNSLFLLTNFLHSSNGMLNF